MSNPRSQRLHRRQERRDAEHAVKQAQRAMEAAQIQQAAALARALAAARPEDGGEESDLPNSEDEPESSGPDNDGDGNRVTAAEPTLRETHLHDGRRSPILTPTLQTWSGNRSVSARRRRRTRAWDLAQGPDASRVAVTGPQPARDPQVRLPKYSGQYELETFLFQLETAAKCAGWSDTTTAAQLVLALEGEALAALHGLADRDSKAAVIEALQLRFGETDVAERSVTALRHRVRKANEPLAVFAAELRRLVCRGYPGVPREVHERTLRRAFLEGLTPEWLSRAANSLPTSDFSTTLLETGRLETSLARFEQPRPRTPAPRARAVHPEEENEEEEEVARQADAPAAPNRYPGRGGPCYRCQEAGHVAADCEAPAPRNRPACQRCGREGHQAGDCRSSRKQDRRPTPPTGNGRGAAQ